MAGSGGRRGRPPHPGVLTPAEWRVLEYLREGKTNAEIGVRLGITPDGVKYHVSNMLAKLNLPDRAALRAWQPGESGSNVAVRRMGTLLATKVGLVIGVGTLVAAVAVAILSVRSFRDEGEPGPRPPAVATTAGMPTASPVLQPASFAMTQTTWSYGRIPGENRHGVTTSTVTIWYRKPDKLRFEGTQALPPLPTTTVVMVNANGVAWTWSSITDVVQTGPATVPEPGDAFAGKTGDWPPWGASDLDTLLAAFRSCYSPVPLGEETVAGRTAWVFDLGRTRCPSASASDFNGPRRLWVDRNTLFVLKDLTLAPDGSVAMIREVIAIGYDIPLSDDLFEPLVDGHPPTLHP